MRKITLTAAAAFSAVAALSGIGASAASAAAPAAAVAHTVRPPPSIHINLHAAYKAALARGVKVEPRAFAPSRGSARQASQAAASSSSCTEPKCDLAYHGGPTQHAPVVYVLFWGPQWEQDLAQSQVKDYMNMFYAGLGTASPETSWLLTMTQYPDAINSLRFPNGAFGSWLDTSAPPQGATSADFTAEADAFEHNVIGMDASIDSQLVIATPSGIVPAGFVGTGIKGYCAYHSHSGSGTPFAGMPFTVLPYVLDAGTQCGADSITTPGWDGTRDGISITAMHEFAETVTDPHVQKAWWDSNDNNAITGSGGEIADKCNHSPAELVQTGTLEYPMKPLWSNLEHDCTMRYVAWAHNPVTGLKGVARYTQLDASWDASANARDYRVTVTRTSTGTTVFNGITAAPSITVHSLLRGTRYAVKVLARPAAPNRFTSTIYLTTKS